MQGGGGPRPGARQNPSPNIRIICNQRYTALVQQALNLIIAAVQAGCINGNCASLNGNTNIHDCVLDFLINRGFTIKCRYYGGLGRTAHGIGTQIDIWVSRILAVCGFVVAEDIATAILHELIHLCQQANGLQSSCCDLSGYPEHLAYLCQVNCFPNTCLTQNSLANNPNIPNQPSSCCGVCE